jgi:hypothetical protein
MVAALSRTGIAGRKLFRSAIYLRSLADPVAPIADTIEEVCAHELAARDVQVNPQASPKSKARIKELTLWSTGSRR